MTSDGAISAEQREFYTVFRQHLNGHEGEFKVEDIERLLMNAKEEVPDLLEEEFIKMGEAIRPATGAKTRTPSTNASVPWPLRKPANGL